MGILYVCCPRSIHAAVEAEAPQKASAESAHTFSEFTLFLFGSGLALFVALLGWSDQIRGFDKDTRELEKDFLNTTGLDKHQFLSVIKAATPLGQLASLTAVMRSEKLKSADSVILLAIFKKWHEDWTHLQHISNYKYNLTVLLTITFVTSGLLSLGARPNRFFSVCGHLIRAELVLLLLPVVLMSTLMGIIIYSSNKERALKDLLMKMSDMV
jgi:hypothetical protein